VIATRKACLYNEKLRIFSNEYTYDMHMNMNMSMDITTWVKARPWRYKLQWAAPDS